MKKPLLRFTLLLLICLFLPLAATAQVVDIPDPNLRAVIEAELGKAVNAPITADELGRVDIYAKLSVIVGARIPIYRGAGSPRPLTNTGWNPQTIRVEPIRCRDSYLDTESSILENRPTEVQNRL